MDEHDYTPNPTTPEPGRARRAFVSVRSKAGSARVPILSGVTGAAIVAILGAIAISAGWIEEQRVASAPAPVAAAPTEPASTATRAESPSQIYAQDAPGVVHIEASQSGASEVSPLGGGGGTATGSGFVTDTDGHIITNAHVVDGSHDIKVTFSQDQNNPVAADVVGVDPSTDIAVLKVDTSSANLHPLPLGSSTGVQVGEPVVAIGNPFALDNTVTSGIVSAIQRQISAPNNFTIENVIQTDAPINPGNSGGPLIDGSAKVIGVNSQIATGGSGGGSVGIGFAVPIDTARSVAQQLIDNGEVKHAFLGLTVADVTPDLAKVLNLGATDGALVQEVVPGGPADKAGIKGGSGQVSVGGSQVQGGGDVIVSIDGTAIHSGDGVVNAVDSHSPGDELQIELARGSQRVTVTATLGDRPTQVKGDGSDQQPRQGKDGQVIPGLPFKVPGLPPGLP